jgi:hypothetical protein
MKRRWRERKEWKRLVAFFDTKEGKCATLIEAMCYARGGKE